ncbi:MAG: hypothetical protein EOP84_11855 [Verrucomicrobiaceae bacterium]|nr:MAG: hypothetical protein EOP84_11855 [Verrucomicrobiaceae bacterium]
MSAAKSSKSCFIISPIGDEGSEVRKRADQILRHVINPAVNNCGYESVRADKIAEPGMITSQVIQHIIEDPLVIADLTGANPNVFYELALRHAVRRPLVQLIQKGDKIPFDVAGMRTIPVDHTDLDSVDEARRAIEQQIKAVEGKSPAQIDSPVSVSLELQHLKQSENPEDRSVAQMLSLMSDLQLQVANLTKTISDPYKLLPPRYFAEMSSAYGNLGSDELVMVSRELSNLSDFLEKIPNEKNEKFVSALHDLRARVSYLAESLRYRVHDHDAMRHGMIHYPKAR